MTPTKAINFTPANDNEQLLYEPIGEYWLCAGSCGDWKKGMAAAHNGSGYVCHECEQQRIKGSEAANE